MKALKGILLVLLGIVLLFAYIAGGSLLAYRVQPTLTEEEKQELDGQNIWGDRTAEERAAVIEDNEKALEERVCMIQHATQELILSTFAFHADNSGKVLIGALLEAADQGVDVKILVDGFESWTAMEWNPYFYALSSHPQVQIKVYNKANPLLPWKLMGRMHDKYLIADDSLYILGGRNSYDYFLGDFPTHKNFDRDVLVYCEQPEANISIQDLKTDFSGIWEQKACKLYHDQTCLADQSSVKRAREDIEKNYAAYCAEEKEALQDTDYRVRTSKVDRIALLHNPTGYASKKPELWYQLTSLMKSAEHSVKIHTPYIICNDYMYDSLAEIADQVDQVSIMTNSVGNNGNPFGGADYLENKDKILATGVDVWEYEGGTSYHGKSVLIDDRIAVVGSFNLDMRSVYLDTELMLVIDSKEVAGMLGDAMDAYETKARKANPDGTYENPNHVEPRKISEKKQRQIELIRKFGKNLRFLF